YFNISETGRRLQISRELSETAREITERIAEDVKKEGVSLSGADFSPGTTYDLWKVGYETRYG
ncbi:hypothetical protein KC711_07625, partial [Candidatus Peregrinibacteria bacterium]|nr:hypothetical protein [Candidatus Peregrinibacteria bacterium]